MDKIEYFKISQEKGLSSRCPLLDFCQRRAQTVYFFNEYYKIHPTKSILEALLFEGDVGSDYIDNEIKMSGELPMISNGKTNGHFLNVCPEVNLFDPINSLNLFKGTASTEGTWDTEENPKFRIFDEKHYSECLEFSKHFYNNRILKETNSTKTKKTECFAYLMIDLKTGFHKIGISNDPIYREKTLQSEQPKIETVCSRKFVNRRIALEFESELHKKFKHKRVRGEWFDLNPIEIEEIKKIMTT